MPDGKPVLVVTEPAEFLGLSKPLASTIRAQLPGRPGPKPREER